MKSIFYILLFLVSIPLNAQKLNKKLFDSIEHAINKTYILNDQSEYGKAIAISNQLLESLEIQRDTFLMAKLYSSLSYSYSELQDKEKALSYGYKAVELNTKTKDTSSLILDYNDLGVTYEDFGLNDKAKEAFLEAARLAEAQGSYKEFLYPMFNLANILVTVEKKYIESEPYLYKTLEYAKKTDLDKNGKLYVDLYISLGVVNYKLKRYKKSDIFFEKGLKIATEEKYFNSILNLYEKKAMLFSEEKKYEKALKYIDQSIIIRDSIEKRKEIDIVKKIETQYKLKENEEKLKLIEVESAAQEMLFQKSKHFNEILIILLILLLLAVYMAFKNNKKLKIAKNKAERLTNIKSAFYSEISHELRTPLYAVIELSNLLLKENVTYEHKEYLESLNFSANHLMALVNNVLELNKVESGKLSVQQLNFSLKYLFSNIINSLEYALTQSNNTISLSYDNAIPEQLTGDSLKLSQVMINLISNAIKFTRNGHIDVIVKKLEDSQNEIKLYFEVSDNGSGISVNNQKKIFDAYYQDTYQSDQIINGTGLGLSIVHRLLDVMGSQIKIESEVNKGSKFFFELSFKNIEEVTTSQNIDVIKESIKGLHLLIVDDNLVNQLVTKKILESLDITFNVVNSGLKAIDITKNIMFDCILMDLHMPEIDGYTASKRIREFNSTIPIIAFTAANSEVVEDRIKKAEMNGCVYKPFFTSDLVKTISQVVVKK